MESFDVEGFAYRYPLWNHGEEDDCGEFLLYVSPRLQRMRERYVDRGKPVAYWSTVLRFEWWSYLRRKKRERARRPDFHAAIALMATDDAPPDEPWKPRVIEHDTTRRDIVVAAVKACCELDDAQVAVLAESTGRADLPELIGRARLSVDLSRANRVHARRCRALGQRLAAEDGQYSRCYERASREARAVRAYPSNRQVAEILGIPKGTVDTSLFRLRRRGRQELVA